MKVFDVGWALLLLPLAGVAASYLGETRRGVAAAIYGSGWLTLAASLVLLGAVVAHPHPLHQSAIVFWSFSVTQTPFNAATSTLLPASFQVGVGYSATYFGVIFAVLISLVTVVGEAQLMASLRSSPQLPAVIRMVGLLAFAALLVALAPGLFQMALGFGLTGLAALLLVGGGIGSGALVRRLQLAWAAGGAALLLGVSFVYVKFAGQVTLAATSGKHPASATPYGVNLSALYPVWEAAHRGAVHAVGGRTLTLAAVLFLVAAACAAGQLPLQGVWRSLGAAPSAAASVVQGLAGVVVPAALLLEVLPLLHIASGSQPVLLALGALSGLVGAILALGERSVRRFPAWVGLSQAGMVLMAVGLNSPSAAVQLAIAAALVNVGLGVSSSRLALDLRLETVDKLGLAWRQARPSAVALLAALLAAAGVLGLGAYLARSEVMAAAFGSGPHQAELRALAEAAAALSSLLVAAGCGRLARGVLRGEEPLDPREARSARRQLTQGRRQASDSVPLAAAGLAVAAGALGLLVGHLLPEPGAIPGAPDSGPALGLMVVLPLLGLGLGWLTRAGFAIPGPALAVVGGGAVVRVGERLLLVWPGRVAELVRSRLWGPAGDAALGWAGSLLEPSGRERSRTWDLWSGTALVALLVLGVAAASWWGLA